MTLKYIWRSFSLGCHFHVHFSYPWHAFASHGLPAIAELLVCRWLRLFVCNAPSKIDSSPLFLDGIQPFLGHQFSMAKATKRCSSIFDLLPWQRNLGYFGKNFKLLLLFCFPMESSHFWMLVVRDPLYKTLFFDFWFRPPNPQNWLPKIWTEIAYNSACMADRPEMFAPNRGFSGTADSMEPCTMFWGRPLLLWQRHIGKFGLFFDKIAHESSCMPDRPDMFGPTSGDDQQGWPLLSRQRHLAQARSLIAYRLVCLYVCL